MGSNYIYLDFKLLCVYMYIIAHIPLFLKFKESTDRSHRTELRTILNFPLTHRATPKPTHHPTNRQRQFSKNIVADNPFKNVNLRLINN